MKAWAGVVLVALATAGCGPKALPALPGAPAYPEYLFPAPAGLSAGASTLVERGWRYLQVNDLRSAAGEFREALARVPDSVEARTGQAYVDLAGHRQSESLRAFDAALARRPDYAPALVGRGYVLLALERESDALEAFEAALAGGAALPDVSRRVDVLRFRRVQESIVGARAAVAAGRLDEARIRYTQALGASPDSAFMYRELAAVERAQGHADAALADLRRAVELDPSEPDGLTALGALLDERGEWREAESVYRQALAIEPTDELAATVARLAERARESALPAEFQAIGEAAQISRGDLAALIGVRFEETLRETSATQVVLTDLQDYWAAPWVVRVASAGIIEPFANHTFQPRQRARRVDLAWAARRLIAMNAPSRPGLRRYLTDGPRIADVGRNHLSYPAAATAVAAGIVPLLQGDRFEMARSVSGAEAVEALGRLRRLVAAE